MPMTDSRLRLQYLDALRGWAIFMMVWVHSTWLLLGANECYLQLFGELYVMPLFFTVSGWLRGRHRRRQALLWRRWIKMLACLAAGSIGFAVCFGMPLHLMFTDCYYYWFFTALLLCEMIYELCAALSPRILPEHFRTPFYAAASIGIAIVCGLIYRRYGMNTGGIPWYDMTLYLPFYALGILMQRYGRLGQLLTSLPAAIVGFLVLALAIITWQQPPSLPAYIGSLGGVAVSWYVMRLFEGRLRLLAWTGRHSLGIFLLSYFVLRGLEPVGMLVPRSWVDSPLQIISAFIAALMLTPFMGLVAQGASRASSLLINLCKKIS